MAISRWTKARLQIVAVVTAIGAAIGIAVSWLLSRILEFPYDVAEFEQGARNGLTIGAVLATLDLFYVQDPRGAWLRRLSFGRAVLLRACLFTGAIVACFALNRLIFGLPYGFERSGLDYFGLPLLRDTMLGFVIFLVISEFLQMRRVIGGRTLNNFLLGRYHRPVREERVFMLLEAHGAGCRDDAELTQRPVRPFDRAPDVRLCETAVLSHRLLLVSCCVSGLLSSRSRTSSRAVQNVRRPRLRRAVGD